MQTLQIMTSLLYLSLFVACIWLPAWFLAARLDPRIGESALVRLPLSVGIALVAYLSFVNLAGRLVEDSTLAVYVYLLLNLAFCSVLLWRHRSCLSMDYLWRRRREWLWIVVLAAILAVPQWFHAVSGNRWDEVASSSIHLTAANQFAEGMFPPRHNAFPDIAIKYHYGFTILSGTVHWLTDLSSNVSIDVASTWLWLFTFLFIFAWISRLGLSRLTAAWGGFALLLGGGLSWLYLPSLRVYKGFQKVPPESALVHSFDPTAGWWSNLITVMKNQVVHLGNASGDIFPLPFDIGIHYQQHAVALGIALSLVSAFFFWLWQSRKDFAPVLLIINIFCFGLVFLGHSVFGGISSITAGLVLANLWVRNPTRIRFLQAVLFTTGVTAIAFLHGGMLSTGPEYGLGLPLAIRENIGYITGDILDQVNWLLSGFGLLPILSIVTLWVWWNKRKQDRPYHLYLLFFGTFAFVSFMIPQFLYFSHAGGVEEQTEISKFFFCTRFALAALSVIGIDFIARRIRWWGVAPVFLLVAVTPLAVSYSGALSDDTGKWEGFYRSPYDWSGGKDYMASGKALKSLKRSNRDQYIDFSGRETKLRVLSELLVYGGSVFTVTPTRYEVTGFGFLIAEDQVAGRFKTDAQLSRLLPGSPERSRTTWLYTVSRNDLPLKPIIVRSRFARLVSEGILEKRFDSGGRELYEFTAETNGIDSGIEMYWKPKVITQIHADWDGDSQLDPIFFNYREGTVSLGSQKLFKLDRESVGDNFVLVYPARLPGDDNIDLFVGNLVDAEYSRGDTVSAMVRRYPYQWRTFNSLDSKKSKKLVQWSWKAPIEIPVIGDSNGDGFDELMAYQVKTGRWYLASRRRLAGPALPEHHSPLPVTGRFLAGSKGDLAVWSPVTGWFKIQGGLDDETTSLQWGGREGDILVPGDYDGDGMDELGIWQPHSNTWWIKKLPDGPPISYKYGSPDGIPLPADYDHDGRLDLAYWIPTQSKIYVSLDRGKTTKFTIDVPPDSIPIFVRMY